MTQTPPTTPGPLPAPRSETSHVILRGMGVHAIAVLLTCFITPIAMNSNLWPIAGVFWSVLTVPVALASGALTGFLTKRLRPPAALAILVFTAAVLAVMTGIIIANNG